MNLSLNEVCDYNFIFICLANYLVSNYNIAFSISELLQISFHEKKKNYQFYRGVFLLIFLAED